MIKNNLSDEEFNIFAQHIEEKSGIYLDLSKKNSLEIGLVLRMDKKRIKTYEKYYKYLVFGPASREEFKELLSLITINETQFYRYPAQFHALKNEILPLLVQEKIAQNNHKIKIWSAGCSSGEEAYSIAMLLRETIGNLSYFDIEILATDIDKQILVQAEEGIYAPRTLRLLNQKQVSEYFTKLSEKRYKVKGNLRRMIKFSYLNLTDASANIFAGGSFDIIFCRNVLIYFKPETTKQMLNNFYQCLNEGGYLFAGHSESLFHLSEKFKALAFRHAFIYQKSAIKGKAVLPIIKPSYFKPKKKSQIKVPSIPRIENRVEPKKAETKEQDYKKALELFLQAKIDDCQVVTNKILQSNPNMPKTIILQAVIFMEKSNLTMAKEQLAIAKKLDPLLVDSYFFSASINSLEGNIDEAIKELKKVLFIDKSFAIAHYNLANLYRARGKVAKAMREYANAIEDLADNHIENLAFYCGGFSVDLLLQSAKDSLDNLKREKAG